MDLDWRGSVGAKSLTMMFARVRIVTVSEGEITTLHIGLKGAMNALYLEDLAEKTRRGLRARVEAGRSGGGVSYGYRVVRVPEGEARGDREIAPEEAAIVQWMFRAFADGVSAKMIRTAPTIEYIERYLQALRAVALEGAVNDHV